MATSTSGASKFFPKAQEGFSTTTSGSVSSGATAVGLNSTGNYSNGDTVVLIIDPGVVGKEQSFTGVIDTSGVQVTGVVWTSGTNVSHSSGATVVDYVAAAHIDLISAGILKSHNDDGTPKSGITYPASTFTIPTITDFTSATHSHANNAGGGQLNAANALSAGTVNFANLLSTIFSGQVLTQANAGTAGGTMSYINLGGVKLLWMISAQQNVGTGGGTVTITLPTSFFTAVTVVMLGLDVLGTTFDQGASMISKSASSISFNQWAGTNGSTQSTSVIVIGT